jgi:lipopolysaccharide transport system permease protein
MVTDIDKISYIADLREDIIRPRSGWLTLDLPLLWRFRDLLFAFAWRDIKLRYRQTFLGVSWVVLQPLMGAAIFTIVFGMIAKLPSQGLPYFVISYAGLVGWTLYSTALTRISASLVANAELIRKVFFPRLLLPLGVVPCLLLDFLVAAVLMAVLMVWYRIAPTGRLAMFPVATLVLLAQATGIGLIAGSLAVRYRDVQYVLPLFIQLLMFASPVGYSAAAVPATIRAYYNLNPLAAPLEVMRWSLIGIGHFDPANFVYSALLSALALVIGLIVFQYTEREFADVI